MTYYLVSTACKFIFIPSNVPEVSTLLVTENLSSAQDLVPWECCSLPLGKERDGGFLAWYPKATPVLEIPVSLG